MKSQYLYINTANREQGTPSQFVVSVAPAIQCEENERLSLSITSFKMTRTWNWVDSTNNTFVIKNTLQGVNTTISIPPANYTFKKLAREINNLIISKSLPISVGIRYDSSTNRFGFTGEELETQIDFTCANSAYDTLKFPKSVVTMQGYNDPVWSTAPLSIDKAQEFRLYVENVPTSNTAPNFENDTTKQLQPSQCCFVMRADLAPYSTEFYTAQEILFTLDLDSHEIQKLVFSLRDEQGRLADYLTSDYLFSVRIDTISLDRSAENEQIELLKDILEYQRLQFVGANIHNIE